jgi:hypothetical protein
MKAYWIDVTKREISEVEYTGLADLQRMVGGYIEIAFMWQRTRDVLFVDEEGLLKNLTFGFRIPERPDQAFAGNGVLVGREVGDSGDTVDPAMTLQELCARVRFVGGIT